MEQEHNAPRALLDEMLNDSELWEETIYNLPVIVDERARKKHVLKKYCDRPATIFKQFDAFLDGFDDVVRPNKDGVALMGGDTVELMSGIAPVRVLVIPDSPKEKVIAALRGIADWIERDTQALKPGLAKPCPTCGQRPVDEMEIPF